MKLPHDPLTAASDRIPNAPEVDSPLDESDPKLEREFEELAQWLLDVYLWRLEQERKTPGIEKMGRIDNRPPPATI
jgi:hypothetical protein